MPSDEKRTQDVERVEAALRGDALYGDDFTRDEIAAWFEAEREGYSSLRAPGAGRAPASSVYTYRALAELHGYRWLPSGELGSILGVGCADGTELAPLVGRARDVTILEPSDRLAVSEVAGKPVRYVKPDPSGMMPFGDGSFDLVVAFSVLHHIPNVSTVVREMRRVLRPGGHALMREPSHSMGDWRRSRPGLTRHERGIPAPLFRRIVHDAGFEIVRAVPCMYSALARLLPRMGLSPWASPVTVRLDAALCALPVWSRRYHATSTWQRLRPTALALVVRRPASDRA